MHRPALSLVLLLAACQPTYLAPPTHDGVHAYDDAVLPPGRLAGAPAFAPHDGPMVVFLDVNGGPVLDGPWSADDSHARRSFIAAQDSEVPPADADAFGMDDTSFRTALRDELAALFDPVQVKVVTEEPAGDFVRVVVGGTAADLGLESLPAGIAPLDVDDRNANDVVFVFSETMASYGYDVAGLARVAAHEVGHSVGLSHIDVDGAVMNPVACHCDATWDVGPIVGREDTEQDSLAQLVDRAGETPRLSAAPVDVASTRDGYWVLTQDGGVHGFGVPDLGPSGLTDPVALVPTPSGEGWWAFGADGEVVHAGDAGDEVAIPHDVVDAAAAPGAGFYAVSVRGEVTARAGAPHRGNLSSWFAAVDHIALVPGADGYWIVSDVGHAWSFHEAWTGSYGAPVVDALALGDGHVGLQADGTAIALGDAPAFEGEVREGVVAATADPDGGGWVLRDDGTIEARGGTLWLGEPRWP